MQHDISILTERLAGINEGLARKIAVRNDYDRTIAETEAAYKKVGEEESHSNLVISAPPALSIVHSFYCPLPYLPPPSPLQILESSQSLLHVLKRDATSLKEKAKVDSGSRPSLH